MVQLILFEDLTPPALWEKNGGWENRLKNFLEEKRFKGSGFCSLIFCLKHHFKPGGQVGGFELVKKEDIDENDSFIIIFSVKTKATPKSILNKKIFKKEILGLIKFFQRLSSYQTFLCVFHCDKNKLYLLNRLQNTPLSNKREIFDIINKFLISNKILS